MADRVGQRLGNYRLIRLLGRGGFAEVYLGQHVRLDMQAAIKVLHAQLTDNDVKNFYHEAETIASLIHPHIVRLLDFDVEDGVPFLVMDYAPNGSLRQRHPNGTRLALTTIVSYVTEVAEALQYAHDRKLIHRDVKPENMLLGRENDILLSDFGLALIAESSLQQSTQDIVGTVAYISPEQIQGKPRSASDQYSLGVVVYEWLNGDRPFHGSFAELCAQHMFISPALLHEKIPAIPLDVEQVVMTALAKEPKQRFESVQAFANALEQASQVGQFEKSLKIFLPPVSPSSSSSPSGEPVVSPDQAAINSSTPPKQFAGVSPHTEINSRLGEGEGRDTRPASLIDRQDRRNRERLLKRVRNIWIEGVLERSLHDADLLTLDLHEQPDAVENPWGKLVQEAEQKEHSLPAGTHIIEVYDHVGGELLILGEPGAGKTTLLLELARDVLKRAVQDSSHPIPVVLNLSSWAEKRQTLANWLVEDLFRKYQVPRKVGRAWIEADELLLLLDGLDEVPLLSRAACVRAINIYRQEHNLVPMVLCCRKDEYSAQAIQVNLHGAVTVQPLTLQQIDDYLSQTGLQLEAVRSSLREDQGLQDLVKTPLMLSILTLAYQGTDVDSLGELPSDKQQDHLFEVYVERMLGRRRVPRYSHDQVRRWLTWLAQQMKQHNQAEFYLERMQMDWVPVDWTRWLLPGIIIGLVYGLFFGLVKGIDYAFMQGLDQNGRVFTPSRGVIDGLLIGALNALLFGLLNGYIFRVVEGQRGIQTKENWLRNFIKVLEKRPVYGLVFGVLNGLLIGLLVDWPAGLYNGLFIGVIYAVLGKLDLEIQPAEVLTWSWMALRKNVVTFVTGGVLIGLCYGLFTGLYWLFKRPPHHNLTATEFFSCLIFGLIIGLVFGLLVVLIRGLSHDRLDERNILKPNQGIRNSARNSVLLGIASWLLFGLFLGVIYGVILQRVFQAFGVSYVDYKNFFPMASGWIVGLANGLAVGAFFAMRSGGTACIQHLLLRLSLWRARCIPWRYTYFLDDMAERLLLRKVGGGYIFIHRLLLDHLATLDTDHSSQETLQSSKLQS